MADLTADKVCAGKAGYWNFVCAPFVLFWRSLTIFCFPCVHVFLLRLAQPLQKVLCFLCFSYPYEDPDFFGAAALGDFNDGTTEEDTDWVRAHELDGFEGNKAQLFQGKIEPADLCQGAIGDCWLVAAFACAAEFEDCIRNQFLTKEYNVYGRYQVRIFDPIKTRFEIVTVDDRIPCKKGRKSPRFLRPNGNELWAIILEKAYAKFCGSYANLEGGFVLWGWHAMTGDNVFQLSRDKATGRWKRQNMVATEDPNNRRACWFQSTPEDYTDDQMWTLLKKYDVQKALMSASISKSASAKFDGPCGEEMLEKEGLVAGHAYSIIQAREVTEGAIMGIVGGTMHRLLQVRNPWGSFEWKGAWSDKSVKWIENPGITSQLNHTVEDDGCFWISFADFESIFTRVNVCDRSTTNDLSLPVNEDDGTCGVCKGCVVGCCYYWLCCAGAHNLYFGHTSTHETLDAKEEKSCLSCLGPKPATTTTPVAEAARGGRALDV